MSVGHNTGPKCERWAKNSECCRFFCFLLFMPTKKKSGPPIADNPAYAQVMVIYQQLHQNERESFFKRVTGSRSASILMREILNWFLPGKGDPSRPRTDIHKHDRYWFCRTRDEWKRKHEFTQQELETCYQHCADLIVRRCFMFAAQRRTHYSVHFEKLLELMKQDEVLQSQLRNGEEDGEDDNASHAVVSHHPENRRSVPGVIGSPVHGDTPAPSVIAQESADETQNNTGCAGPAAPVIVVPSASGAAAPGPLLVAQVERAIEDMENPPELSNQKIQTMLKAVEGKDLPQKMAAIRCLSPYARYVLGYLVIWQQAFEEDHPRRKHHFNDEHVRAARELADQELPINRFQEVLWEAWEVRGTSEGHDPLFMCRNHSRKFGLFCKHFTRMEEELVQGGML